MSQWGLSIIVDGATFLPHVATNAFEPIGPSSLIDDIIMTDNGGDPEKAKATHQRLGAQLVGKPYAGIRQFLQTNDADLPQHFSSKTGARVTQTATLEETLLRQLEDANKAVGTAREYERNLMRTLFPVGEHIRWKVGQHIQSGFVDQHSSWEDALWATNEHTKKRVKVTSYAIREALKDA